MFGIISSSSLPIFFYIIFSNSIILNYRDNSDIIILCRRKGKESCNLTENEPFWPLPFLLYCKSKKIWVSDRLIAKLPQVLSLSLCLHPLQWHFVFPPVERCSIFPTLIQTSCQPPTWQLSKCSLSVWVYFWSACLLFGFLDSSYKWNHGICLPLTYFSPHNTL